MDRELTISKGLHAKKGEGVRNFVTTGHKAMAMGDIEGGVKFEKICVTSFMGLP